MNSPDGDELRALRERAYGPNADIHDDDAAFQRLRDLEVGGLEAVTPTADRTPVTTHGFAEPSIGEVAVASAPEKASHLKPRWRLPVLWVASILIAVLATAFITATVAQRAGVGPLRVDAAQITSLGPDPAVDVPASYGSDVQAFADFHGLRVLVARSEVIDGSVPDDECVVVTTSAAFGRATASSAGGPTFSSCAADTFPATVSLRVTSDLPEELLSAYPEGSALQFVFDEARAAVVVFSSPNP